MTKEKIKKKQLDLIENTSIVMDENGAIKSATTFKKRIVPNSQEPDYVKLYFSDVYNLTADTNNMAVDVLYEIVKMCDFHNEITLNDEAKYRIAARTGMSLANIKKIIKKLLDRQILFRAKSIINPAKVVRGRYILNPCFFGRGKWEDIYPIRICMEYDEKGKKFIFDENRYYEYITQKVTSEWEDGQPVHPVL